MKKILLVCNGMADEPLRELGGKTPLQAAKTPHMDRLAKQGVVGRVQTTPESAYPDGDLAFLTLLGYEPQKYYPGRGMLEAVHAGVKLAPEEVAFRCNFVTVNATKLIDYAAGHIGTREASILVNTLNDQINMPQVRFYHQRGYQQLMVVKDHELAKQARELSCVAPQEISGKKFKSALPKGKGRKLMLDIINRSHNILSDHDINKVRIDLHENPANMIWPWGQGRSVSIPAFKEKYGQSGVMVAGSTAASGIGKLIGLETLTVPGATGYYDTDYLGKAEYGARALEKHDFLVIHVQAADEASLSGNLKQKIQVIEDFDSFVVAGILKSLESKADFRIMISANISAPVSIQTHTHTPVLFLQAGRGIKADQARVFDESTAAGSKLEIMQGHTLLQSFLN